MQSLKKKTEGFTIIEVMIVLVIAAVIILIVFLAVPALQRNSRNNQRKNDIARLLSASAEYKNNHGNTFPPDAAAVTSLTGQLAFYDSARIIVLPAPTASTQVSLALSFIGGGYDVGILPNATCSGSGSTVAYNAGSKTIAIYNSETGSGVNSPQCVAS